MPRKLYLSPFHPQIDLLLDDLSHEAAIRVLHMHVKIFERLLILHLLVDELFLLNASIDEMNDLHLLWLHLGTNRFYTRLKFLCSMLAAEKLLKLRQRSTDGHYGGGTAHSSTVRHWMAGKPLNSLAAAKVYAPKASQTTQSPTSRRTTSWSFRMQSMESHVGPKMCER